MRKHYGMGLSHQLNELSRQIQVKYGYQLKASTQTYELDWPVSNSDGWNEDNSKFLRNNKKAANTKRL